MQPRSISFKWNKSLHSSSYFLQVARDSLFSNIFHQDSTITDIFEIVSGLTNNTIYYWRIRALNNGGKSDWTSKRYFSTLPSFALSLNALNGNVTANPATGPFDSAIVVSLKAIPSPGFHFVSWSDGASGVIDSTTVTMNSAKSVTANFSLNTYQLTANAVTGGTITSPEGTFPQSVDHGTETTITALGNQDYIFDGWSVTSGLAIIADSNALFTTVTLNSGNATVQAKFIINTYTVAFQVQEGSGGHIIGTMEQTIMHGGNCTEVTAVAGIDSTFSGWTGDSISPDNPLVITNVTSDMTITTTIEATNPSPKNK